MDRDSFLNTLSRHLAGELTAEEVSANVEYYRDYINSEIRMGKSEEEVMSLLGDPRLIAKSIKEARDNRQDFGQESNAQEENASYRNEGQGMNGQMFSLRQVNMPPALKIVLLVIMIILCVALFFVVAPIALIVLIIVTIVRASKGR